MKRISSVSKHGIFTISLHGTSCKKWQVLLIHCHLTRCLTIGCCTFRRNNYIAYLFQRNVYIIILIYNLSSSTICIHIFCVGFFYCLRVSIIKRFTLYILSFVCYRGARTCTMHAKDDKLKIKLLLIKPCPSCLIT